MTPHMPSPAHVVFIMPNNMMIFFVFSTPPCLSSFCETEVTWRLAKQIDQTMKVIIKIAPSLLNAVEMRVCWDVGRNWVFVFVFFLYFFLATWVV